MIRQFLFSCLCLVVAASCDPAVPPGAVPEGVAVQREAICAQALPCDTTTTDPTDPGPTCSYGYCADASDCSVPACYVASCDGTCCGRSLAPGAKLCSSTCCMGIHGTCSCSGATAILACAAGWGDCDGVASNGCERDLTTVTSCGASCGGIANCVNSVQHVAGADVRCTSSTCGYVNGCQTGWGDCDGATANGCETSLLTDKNHCGGCGTACTAPSNADAVCTNGGCGFVCKAGFVRCGDVCKECCGDGDCTHPPNKCKVGVCTDGACTYKDKACVFVDCYTDPVCDEATGECKKTPLTDKPCGANKCSDTSGNCNAGVCDGATPKDCSVADSCKVGLCDLTNGCSTENVLDGTTCTSTDKCIETGTCLGGQCLGASKTCPDPGICKSTLCNASNGNCDVVALVKGTPCTINNPCRQNEACDGDGNCGGTNLSDGTPCDKACGADQAAMCQGGECSCVSTIDMMPPPYTDPDDAGIGDLGKKGADKSGCNVASGATASPWLGLLLALASARLSGRRRRR